MMHSVSPGKSRVLLAKRFLRTMEKLKTFEQILEPDSRYANLLVVDRETKKRTPVALKHVHDGLLDAELSPEVPERIQDHFTTARHLTLYSWFVYRFLAVAQMQAYGSLEFALRERLGHGRDEKPPGLRPLLNKAVDMRLVQEQLIRDWPGHSVASETMEDQFAPEGWLRQLPEFMSSMRNDLAHGSFTLMPDGGRTLRVVADIINQLYPPAELIPYVDPIVQDHPNRTP